MSVSPDPASRARQQAVLGLLQGLRGLDPLKQLFSALNYEPVNRPLSRRNWPQVAAAALADDPLLLAGQGDFHVIYSRLRSDNGFHLVHERAVVNRLLRDHPYALFLFSDAGQRNWHFVNVKLVRDAEDEANKDPRIRRLFRRISVGPYERLRTASDRITLLDIASVQRDLFGLSPLAIQRRHDEAFDVEKVTEAFYLGYKEVFRRLEESLVQQTNDPTWAHDNALQFLNRLMFLYFIQRKRWLGDNTEFLRSFWEAYYGCRQPADTFFNQWLSVLFFEAFNKPRFSPRRHLPKEVNDALIMAPFLNGGLFERNRLDDLYPFDIPDPLFRRAFDFLEGYNFTISEDSPLDQEVAVDPEMIGYVYETLVNIASEEGEEEDRRGEAGIFYTHRTEIDLMCRLALVDNLANHLGEEHKPLLYQAVFALTKDEKDDADAALSRRNVWPALDRHLRQITIVDPACGSGSFLVGMLSVLADLRERADGALGHGPRDAQYRYELKKEIIGRSLYGVDVMEWAVRTAELRLWLQLVVDADLEPGLRQTRPLLPNLSFKVRCGDSLVQEVGGVDLSHVHGRAALPAEIKGRLTQLQAEKLKFYRNERAPGTWNENQIRQEERRLFRDILDTRAHRLGEEKKRLEYRIAHPAQQPALDMPGVEPGKAGQLELRVAEWRRELDAIQTDLADVEEARAALRSAKDVPFVWDVAFVEVFAGDEGGFDIVIGNPPYVRHEKIAPPRLPGEMPRQPTLEQRREYKDKLARSVYALYPAFFNYLPHARAPGRKLDAKSDLYIYFYFHGLSLLNAQGSFCFITSNSWLDVGYGRDLQEFLLRHSHVRLVLDNQVKRSFKQADINTVIVLLGAPDDRAQAGLDRSARFVMCTVPFDQVLNPVAFLEMEEAKQRSTRPEFRVHARPQRDLLQEGMARQESALEEEQRRRRAPGRRVQAARYEANKWGGKYLRAPDIYWRILEKAGDKLVRLGDIAEVRRGFTTGANDFFYVKVLSVKNGIAHILCDDGSEHEIEEEFLRPVVKTPRPYYGIRIPPNVAHYLVWCDRPPGDLSGTGAMQYIRWGESQGFNRRPSCASRNPWYALNGPEHPTMLWPSAFFERHICYECPKGFVADKVFYTVSSHRLPVVTRAFLNSTIVALCLEVEGYVLNHGGIFQTTEWLSRLGVVADTAAGIREAYESICKRDILLCADELRQADRQALDKACLKALGVSPFLTDELYEIVPDYVRARIEKARRGLTRAGRLETAAEQDA